MGPTRRVVADVRDDDPFWGLLAQVEPGEEKRCAQQIVEVVARSWGQQIPAAVRGREIGSSSHGASRVRQRLEEIAERGGIDPGLIGRCWEMLMARSDRRSRGAHYTPTNVAAQVVELVLDGVFDGIEGEGPPALTPTVWDPSCGGGAFLLAAVRALEARTGEGRVALVERCFATDIDEFALALCDAALQIWSDGAARPNVYCVDALLVDGGQDGVEEWPERLDIIVGNPPFLGQLSTDTTRTGERAERLRARYPHVSRAYLDEAGLFVAMAAERVSVNGAIGLIVPASLLGAADAVDLRRTVAETHTLSRLWVDAGQSFDAAVDVVALVLTGQETSNTEPTTSVWLEGTERSTPTPTPESWAPLLAAAEDSPIVYLDTTTGQLGDLASLTAGFRQHFYGIANAVSEAGDVAPSPAMPALVTSGVIDPLHSRWGTRPLKFAKERWNAPVVHFDRIDDQSVRDWFVARCRPKLLLATQTAVIETIVDPDGSMVPSVPVLVVEPADEEMLWRLAAVLTSPAASAWLYQRAAGTGMSKRAIRLRAKEVAALPLPSEVAAWDAAAGHAQLAHRSSLAGDIETYVGEMRSLGKWMSIAYGVDDSVGSWWWSRLDRRTMANHEAY